MTAFPQRGGAIAESLICRAERHDPDKVSFAAPLESSVGTTFVVSFLLCCAGGANVFPSCKMAQGAHMPGKTTKPRFGLI